MKPAPTVINACPAIAQAYPDFVKAVLEPQTKRSTCRLAARVLESLDITVEEVRAQVARIVGQGDEVTTGQIPFTPRAKKVLELALREALSLGHNYIGTEHILLGLVRENEGVAARILLDFDAEAEKIRNEIIRMLSGPGRRMISLRIFSASASKSSRMRAAT